MVRLGTFHIWWGDVALAALLLTFGLIATESATAEQGWAGSQVVDNLLVAAACLPLAIWRWRPLWTFAATGAAEMIYLGLGTPHGPILIAGLVAAYGLGSRCPLRHVIVAFSGLLIASAAAGYARSVIVGGSLRDVANVMLIHCVPLAIGVVVRVRHEADEDVRSERARLQVMQERLRVAQEVHDVVGHGLTVISMLAGSALHVLDQNPVRVREALEAIRATSKESLDGLRFELDAIRQYEPGPASRQPATTSLELGGLVQRIRDSGLEVNLEGEAAGDGLPHEVQASVYRIVQEALTNVLRHAGPSASVTVSIRCTSEAVVVDVVDTGRGGDSAPEGRGIRGMRARAEALGGTLEAGTRPAGGFAVHGQIPMQGPPS